MEEEKNKEEINLQEEQLHKQDIRGLFISSLIMIALIILISYFFREKIISFFYNFPFKDSWLLKHIINIYFL